MAIFAKNFLAVFCAVFALVTTPLNVGTAGATTARVLSLGGDGAYFKDATGVLRWYGSLSDFPNLAVFELGDVHGGDGTPGSFHDLIGHGGGVHLALDTHGRFGTAAFHFEDDLPAGEPGGAFSCLWSRAFGRLQLGVFGRFTTFGESMTASDISDHGYSQYFHHYGLGLRRNFGYRYLVDLAGEVINSRSESLDAVHHLRPTDDWSSFGLRSRVFINLSENVVLVPVVDHLVDRRAAYAIPLASPADLDARRTAYGLGLNLVRSTSKLIVISAEYREGKQNYVLRSYEGWDALWDRSERSFNQVRGRVGVESLLLPWLTVRAAVLYVRADERVDRVREDFHDRRRKQRVATPVSIGLGLALGDLRVDVVHNDSALINPGLLGEEFLSSAQNNFTCISLICLF